MKLEFKFEDFENGVHPLYCKQAAEIANARLAQMVDEEVDRRVQAKLAAMLEEAPTTKALMIALNALQAIESMKRARGYPTGSEWIDLVKANQEALTAISSILEEKCFEEKK